MHIHIAIFKWKEGVKRADVESALEMVRRVSERVKGVRAIYCGPNTSKWAEGYTDAVVVIGESAEALQHYRDDQLHQEAAALIEKMELHGIGVDFSDPH